LEIEGLTTVKKKCEDKLERSTGPGEAQRRELEQLKDENTAMKAKGDQRMEEVEKLKEEIRRMAAHQDSLLNELAEAKDIPNKSPPPSKPPKLFQPHQQPEKAKGLGGLLGLLTDRVGVHVHERKVVVVTAGSNDRTAKNAVDHGSASGYESAVRLKS
jgi:hypothetical protein